MHLSFGEAQVRLELSDIAKLLLGISGGNRRRDNDIVTRLPVNRGHNALLVTRLQRVDHTQDLSRVTAGRGRVHHGQTDLLARVNDEDRPDGEGNAFLGNVVQVPLVNHVIEEGHLAFSIGDDGELEVGAGDLVDVLDPFTVGAEVVGALDDIFSQLQNSTTVRSLHVSRNVSTYQTNHLDVALLEFILQLGESTQFGGADGGKVGRVGEKDGPAVSDKLVEVDVAVGGLGREVGGCQLVSMSGLLTMRTS